MVNWYNIIWYEEYIEVVVKKEYGSEKGFISVLELIKAIGGL